MNDLMNAAVKGIETIKIASSIVVGVTVILSLPRNYIDIKFKSSKVRKKVENFEVSSFGNEASHNG
jgi:hypothetical protein